LQRSAAVHTQIFQVSPRHILSPPHALQMDVRFFR
jgi:hypothetical protein